MSVENLKCKECGTTYELDASYVCENCFGPLEVSYDYSSGLDAESAKAQDPGRLERHLAIRRLPSVHGTPARPARAGADAVGQGRPPRRAARPGRGLDQERRRQPDPLVQGPGCRGRRRQGPGARLRDRRLRLDREPRQRGRRPRRGCRPGLLRLRARRTSRSRSCSRPAIYGTNLIGVNGNYDDVNRLCTELAADAPLGLRQRQPAPLLRRGLEDARLRDRRAARLDAARPRRLADRLGLALHQARPRLPGVARPRPRRGRTARLQRRPGGGLLPGGDGLRRGLGRLQAAEAGHDRQEPGDRRPRRRPLRARAARGADRRRASTRSPTRRSATAIKLLARDDRRSSPRPPAASPSASSASWPSAASSRPASGSSSTSPARG